MEAEQQNSVHSVGQVSKKQSSQPDPDHGSLLERPGLDSLPVELLNKILAHVSTSDLLCNVARVNKQFHELSKSPHVHLIVTVRPDADEEKASNFLQSATLIRSLYITPTENIASNNCDKKLLAVANHNHLKVLEVSFSAQIAEESFLPLSKSVWWKKLTRFQLPFYLREMYPDQDVHAAIKDIGSDGNLVHLAIGHSRVGLPEAVFELFVGPTLTKIKSLTIYYCCTENELEQITEARKDSLEELVFANGDKNPRTLRRPLKCPKLKVLKIFGGIFDGFNILPKLKFLTTLTIDYFVADHKVQENALPRNSMPSMVDIELSSDDGSFWYSDSDFDEFYDFRESCDKSGLDLPYAVLAMACPNLKNFTIYSKDEYVTLNTFKAVIDNCTQLEVFIWHREPIHTSHPDDIALDGVVSQICETLTNLKIFDLRSWTLTESSEKMIVQNCPNLLAFCPSCRLDLPEITYDSPRHLYLKTGVTLGQLIESCYYSPAFETQESF